MCDVPVRGQAAIRSITETLFARVLNGLQQHPNFKMHRLLLEGVRFQGLQNELGHPGLPPKVGGDECALAEINQSAPLEPNSELDPRNTNS